MKQSEKSFVKKKKLLNFVWKCPEVLFTKNFGRNTISVFLYKNMWIAYLEVHKTNGKIFSKKIIIIKKKKNS